MINMNHKNYYIYELILSLHSNDVYSKSIVSVIEEIMMRAFKACYVLMPFIVNCCETSLYLNKVKLPKVFTENLLFL